MQGDYSQSGLDTNYLYTGQQYDVISELYSLRARYYDASIGRFLSRDTWAYDYQNPVELNRYVYTANNPATWSDPSGNQSLVEYAVGVGTLVTAVAIICVALPACHQGLSSTAKYIALKWDFGLEFNRLIHAFLISPIEFNRKIYSATASVMIGGSILIGSTVRLVGEEDLRFVEKIPLYQQTIDDFIETFPQVMDSWKNYIETIPLIQQSWRDFIETYPLMQELWKDFIETIPLEQQTVWDNVLTSNLTIEEGRKLAVQEAQRIAEGVTNGSIKISSNATGRAITVIVSLITGKSYWAASGELESLDEVNSLIRGLLPNPSLLQRQPYMCGEPAACNKAIKDGLGLVDLENSVIVTVDTETGEIKAPCKNCDSWVYKVFGDVVK